jgi:hypothetical protein
MSDWIKSDELQYIKKEREGVYCLVEARDANDGMYILCKGTVILECWMDSDKNYEPYCKDIICSYYESVDNFHSQYVDEEVREQILAEMIFESFSHLEIHWRLVNEEDIETELQKEALGYSE